MSIRDLWDKPESDAQKAIKGLKDVLGLEVYCEPQWPILIAGLEKIYEDKAQLVNFVVRSIQAWLETFTAALDEPDAEGWAESVLDRIRGVASRLNVTIEVYTYRQLVRDHRIGKC